MRWLRRRCFRSTTLETETSIQSKFNIEQLQKMTNNIEEVCLLGNWTHDISINDKYLDQQLLIQDPYDSVWLKIIASMSYLIGLVCSAIMLAFINYETGHHGNFRTVINQLLSNLYAMVSSLVYPIRHSKNMYHTWLKIL